MSTKDSWATRVPNSHQTIGKRLISSPRRMISVESMSHPATPVPCYLVEWYGPKLAEEPIAHTAAALDDCAASMSVAGSSVRLLTILAVPTDEVLFGVFTAD